MIKQCAACGKDFDAKTSAKYCSACRPAAYKKVYLQARRRWEKNNPDKKKKYKLTWRRNHAEAAREHWRRWYRNHREEEKERARVWREQNPDKVKAQRERARAKYHLERKKARLRALMQANAAKRIDEQQRHKELYQGMSHWNTELPTTSIC